MAENFENFDNENENIEEYLIDLFDDEGNKETFEHLDTVQVDGSDYVICIPYKEEDDGETDEVVILKIEKDDEGDDILVTEEDLEILDRAYEIFKEKNADMFDFED